MPTSRSPMTNEGYFIPFTSPIPCPVDDVLVNRDYMIRFPGSYIPYIIGALKPLARVETYIGESDAELKFAQQQGMELICGVEPVLECDNTQANSILNVTFGLGWAEAMYTGAPTNHVSRYSFSSISYDENGDPQLNEPRFYITSPGWINPGCTWDITFQTRVPGRVCNIMHLPCGGSPLNDTFIMNGQFHTLHYENTRSVYFEIDVCDIVLGLIDLSDVTCGDT